MGNHHRSRQVWVLCRPLGSTQGSSSRAYRSVRRSRDSTPSAYEFGENGGSSSLTEALIHIAIRVDNDVFEVVKRGQWAKVQRYRFSKASKNGWAGEYWSQRLGKTNKSTDKIHDIALRLEEKKPYYGLGNNCQSFCADLLEEIGCGHDFELPDLTRSATNGLVYGSWVLWLCANSSLLWPKDSPELWAAKLAYQVGNRLKAGSVPGISLGWESLSDGRGKQQLARR